MSVGATLVNQINHSNDSVANDWLNENANYKFNLKEHFKHSFKVLYIVNIASGLLLIPVASLAVAPFIQNNINEI
ncbi:MAG: hypothetical protein WCY75_12035 [Sulfurimonadaceae bacterium]|jgi:hypothetical protein|nr:hypothetical protein [Arcobacteraceae bacterium]